MIFDPNQMGLVSEYSYDHVQVRYHSSDFSFFQDDYAKQEHHPMQLPGTLGPCSMKLSEMRQSPSTSDEFQKVYVEGRIGQVTTPAVGSRAG